MTVTAIPAARYHVNPVAAHAYRLPVVHELPSQPVETCDSRTW